VKAAATKQIDLIVMGAGPWAVNGSRCAPASARRNHPVTRPSENSLLGLPKTRPRTLRPYHYLRVAEQDRDNPHLVRERVRCGKPSCSWPRT